MPSRSRLAAVAVIAVFPLVLGACQTSPAPGPAPGAASPPAPPPAQPAAPAATAKPIGAEAARNLAVNCFTCHGPGGRSPGTIPSLHRLSADDIAMQLRNFKSGAKESTVMGRHAKGYSDAEIEAIARFIAAQK